VTGTDPDPEKQAAIDKANADARQAQAAAAQAELQLQQAQTPAAQAAADAAQRKAEAQSNRDAAAAQQDQISALIPDFNKVAAGTLDQKGDQPLFGLAMAQRALAAAAGEVAASVGAALQGVGDVRLLVTSDDALAASDGAYVQVANSLGGLIGASKQLLEPQAKPAPEPGEPAELPHIAFAPVPLIGAVASAVPGFLSLFAAKRSVTSSAATVPELSAAAAAIGALRAAGGQWKIFNDDFRLLARDGEIATLVQTAGTVCQQLVARKAELQAGGGHDDEAARMDDLAKAIETFLGAAGTVPTGAAASLLGEAMARERLHGGDQPFTHALLIKANGGALHETIQDRPLWFKDKFSIVAAVSVSYILISTADGEALAGATISKSAAGHGTIGSSLRFDSAA
jgi:hypothetical protein